MLHHWSASRSTTALQLRPAFGHVRIPCHGVENKNRVRKVPPCTFPDQPSRLASTIWAAGGRSERLTMHVNNGCADHSGSHYMHQ